MFDRRKIVTISLTSALVLGLAPALAACSPQQVVQDTVENAVEDATGADINLDANSLPDGFPAEVPTISGDIVVSGSVGSGAEAVWTVSISVADVTAGYEEAKGKLLAAGFTSDLETTADGASSGFFSSAAYSVAITGANDGTNNVVTYVVSATTAQ